MIPVAFDYARPTTLPDAHDLLLKSGVDADIAILAGGQSLLSALKKRKRKPTMVLDLGGIDELSDVRVEKDTLHVGAMMRQAEFVHHPFISERAPIFLEVAASAGDPMIRRRGTLVGAFCEADPAGDWVPAGLVHDATVVLHGLENSDPVSLETFIAKPRATRIGRGEIVTWARLPAMPVDARFAYRKCKHISIGWSIAGVAVLLKLDSHGQCSWARIAASGALATPQRLRSLEQALEGIVLSDERAVDLLVRDNLGGMEFVGDNYASADYRAERLAVHIRRTLVELSNTKI